MYIDIITDLKIISNSLEENKLHFENILSSIQDIIYTLDVNQKHTGVYGKWLSQSNMTPEIFMGKSAEELLGIEAAKVHVEANKKALNGEFVVYEWSTISNGEESFFQTSVSPLLNTQGIIVGIVGIGRNITEQKKAQFQIEQNLQEKEILLKEVHHRIKNNIASIEGLIMLQSDSSENNEVQKAFQNLLGKIQSIRIIYEKLIFSKEYKQTSVKSYLEDLIQAVVQSFPEKKQLSCHTQIDDFSLDTKTLFPIGLITAELITNSIKHAFPNLHSGNISVKLQKSNNSISLSISDNGSPLKTDFHLNQTGFGLTLVDMLSKQLKGSLTISPNSPEKFRIVFPSP